MKIPTLLISGFLGAGKTTLLNALLESELPFRPGVLVNEFGEVSIDGRLIHGAQNLMELTRGSIFCVCLREGFLQALEEMAQYCPGCLLIEATGIADPFELVEFMDTPVLSEKYRLAGVVTLVDTITLPKIVGTLRAAPRQVEAADLIVLTKDGDHPRICSLVEALAPQAQVVQGIEQGVRALAGVWERSASLLSQPMRETVRDPYQSVTVQMGPYADSAQLQAALERLPVETIRGKGFVMIAGSPVLMQYVAGTWSLHPAQDADGVVVFVGPKLKKESLQETGLTLRG